MYSRFLNHDLDYRYTRSFPAYSSKNIKIAVVQYCKHKKLLTSNYLIYNGRNIVFQEDPFIILQLKKHSP
jgi:hypothetical protein